MIIESSNSGHREFYANYFQKVLGDNEVLYLKGSSKLSVLFQSLFCKRVLLSTADDYLILALIISFSRSLLFKKTELVMIRVEHCFDKKGMKSLLKLILHKMIFLLPFTKSLSIMPHKVEPRLKKITHNCIYDPAFFELDEIDLGFIERKPCESARKEGKLPSEVIFLGVLSEPRNIRSFISIFEESEEIVASAIGRLPETMTAESFSDVKKVKIEPRHLNDIEFVTIFANVGSVWCAFKPEYDNFSGIFCNAIRFGTPIWLSEGSRLHKFASLHGGKISHSISFDGSIYILVTETKIEIERMRQENRLELE